MLTHSYYLFVCVVGGCGGVCIVNVHYRFNKNKPGSEKLICSPLRLNKPFDDNIIYDIVKSKTLETE